MQALEIGSLQINPKINHDHSQTANKNMRMRKKQEMESLLFQNHNTALYLDVVTGSTR